MQVAMRLGPYWWERFKEKKIGDGRKVREYTRGIFLGIGMAVVAFIFYYLFFEVLAKKEILTLEQIKNSRDIVTVIAIITTVLCAGIIFSGIVVSAVYLVLISIAFVRALIATLRFRTIFSFLPPTTDEGQKAVQCIVDRILTFRAIARAKEYSREEELHELIKLRKNTVSIKSENALKEVGVFIKYLEQEMEWLEKSKKKAEKRYYQARDAAKNPSLPIPFEVKDSFKGYLPKTVV